MATYDVNKLTKLSALKQLAEKIKEEFTPQSEFTALSSTVDTISTNLSTVSSKVDGLVSSGGEPNTIETIKVNGTALTPDSDKAVDITVPTTEEINTAVTTGINNWAKEVTENDTLDTFKEVVDYLAQHQGDATSLMSDMTTAKTDISNLQTLVGSESVATQISTALGDYVEKEEGMGLSQNSFTDAEKALVDSIEFATDEEVTSMLTEVFPDTPSET